MGITYKGHSLDWVYWVFDIDGRDWVAVNQSTPEPLKIQFLGRYRNWGSTPLSKAGGFDILSSSTTKTNAMGEKQGTVEWIWNGVRYKSSWVMLAGSEVVVADPEEGIPAEYDYQLAFIGQVPYDGPAGGAVGTGVVSPEVVKAKQEVNTGPSSSGYTPPKPVEVPSAPYGGPSGSGYVEPPAQKPVGTGVASPEVIKAKQEVNTGPSGGGPSGSLPADTAAGPDWVKLGLQLGAAYLLLS